MKSAHPLNGQSFPCSKIRMGCSSFSMMTLDLQAKPIDEWDSDVLSDTNVQLSWTWSCLLHRLIFRSPERLLQ